MTNALFDAVYLLREHFVEAMIGGEREKMENCQR